LNTRWGRDSRRVQQALAGDRSAAEWLVNEHYPRVFRFLAHLTGNRNEAEELTQETFFKAWRGLRQFSGRASFCTWLLSIAYREAVARRERFPTAPLDPETRDAGQDFVQSLIDAVAVERAVTLLPEDLRVTYLLLVEQGLSVVEVADVLGIPKGTVLSRLANARERLKRQLAMRDIVAAMPAPKDPTTLKGVTQL
jgi:RNA polymerase sigma-70 factor, ECF subfamily